EGGAGEPQVASLLDRMVFYIVPRINPDGPEAVLTLPQPIRSRKKKPLPEDEINGLIPQDINRDGLVLQMRVADENGDMRPSDKDPRLLVRRKPTDTQGPFYRVHPEGLIKDWDGFEIRPVNPQYDFNRNFAANWQMEYLQGGAGEHPYSAPEIKALADFAYAHPNICGALGFHCGSNGVLRPSSTKPDDELNPSDLAEFKRIGKMGQEITGFPLRAVVRYSTNPKGSPLRGHFGDWGYEHHGWMVFEIELGSLYNNAGISTDDYFKEPERDHEAWSEQVMDWIQRSGDTTHFVDWKPFKHPQLGEVEIGGWHPVVYANPMPGTLGDIASKCTQFILTHATAAPRLRIVEAEATPLAKGLFKVTASIRNDGYLATNITQQGITNRQARPVVVELQLPKGAEVVVGRPKQVLGHLPGYSTPRKLEWVVRASARRSASARRRGRGPLTLIASCPRAGRDERRLKLG
ncbi:MAG: hypothetical protein FJ279_37085, partial [Planctomycetes bacterium]|nr:hypothetical protein [Planctomycetota bacterium]